ncbi:MAG TPA: TonB family protein [Acidobacteriaceae bacterium]|nr:TonB family protein [Acidobacteriaceae bacterium]
MGIRINEKEVPGILPPGNRDMGYPALRTPEFEPQVESQDERANSGLYLCTRPVVFGKPLPDESLFATLRANLRDAFFPEKQPPLHLTSRPVAVADPLAVRRGPASSILAFFVHATAIAAILWVTMNLHTTHVKPVQAHVFTPIYFKPYIPPTIPAPKAMGGGGGGGAHHIVEPVKGKLPPMVKQPVTPPQILKIDNPKLPQPAAIQVPQKINLPQNTNMPNVGLPNSQQVALASQGPGSNSGFGSTMGGGIGAGHGAGLGAGMGGGYGGSVMSVGGGVTAPVLVHQVQPEFTDQARAAKLEGTVEIQLIVDAYGNPKNVTVVRSLGMGLDQKAIAAVSQYKFKPAMYQGHPVAVQLRVDVGFHLY